MWNWLKKHPDEITLQRYREGLLPDALNIRMAAHLEQCQACEGTLEAYNRLNQLLSVVPERSAPADLAEQILTQVLAQQLVTRPAIVANRAWGVAGGLFALALAAMLFLWPWLTFDGAATAVGGAVNGVMTGLELAGPVISGLNLVLQPLRYPALVTCAAAMVMFAWLASRRVASQEFSL